MSRCFSMTSRISDATMFSAATMHDQADGRARSAIFSSPSAEKSDLFMSAQSCVTYSIPRRVGDGCGDLRRGVDVVDAQLDQIDLVLAEQRAWRRRATTNPIASNRTRYRPRLNRPDDLQPPRPRQQARRRQRHAHASATTESPVATPSFAARSCRAGCRRGSPSGGSSAVRGCRWCTAPLQVGHLRLERRIDAFDLRWAASRGRRRCSPGRGSPAPRRCTCGTVRSLSDSGVVVVDAAGVPHVDVRVRSDDAVAELLLQAGHQRPAR